MPETQFERKFSVLKQEWDQCERAIGRYDTIVFAIRGWGVTVFADVLGASVSIKRLSLIFLAIATTILFWNEANLRPKEFEVDIEDPR